MPVPQETRRIRSAQHYLIDGPLAGKLETVLGLVSRTVNFPIVRVNIVDHDTQHTIRLFGAGEPGAVARTEAFCDTVARESRVGGRVVDRERVAGKAVGGNLRDLSPFPS